jgi:large subunit ribosomal protein L14e
MYEVGRLCVKIAGKDAGKTVIIVDRMDDKFVIIDGSVKRKRCNVKHLEPLGEIVKIKKGASTEEIKKLLEGKIKIPEKKPRKAGERPRKQRKVKKGKEIKEKTNRKKKEEKIKEGKKDKGSSKEKKK